MDGFYFKLGFSWALLLLISLQGVAQTLTVKGIVRDETGETMPGVNVVLKGTTEGTTTDADGAFQITVPDAASILVFSFVGYKVLEETIGTRSTLAIVIEPDISSLNEVVVVAYGEK